MAPSSCLQSSDIHLTEKQLMFNPLSSHTHTQTYSLTHSLFLSLFLSVTHTHTHTHMSPLRSHHIINATGRMFRRPLKVRAEEGICLNHSPLPCVCVSA